MKLKLLLFSLPYLFILSVKTQEINRISVQLGYVINYFEMNQLNTAFSNGFLGNQLDMEDLNITGGNSFRFVLLYQPNKWFDFGLYSGYQYSNKNSTPSFYKMNEYNLPVKECQGRYELRTEAITTGINNSWYIDQFVNTADKDNFLNHLRYGVELSAGVGFSKIISDLQPPKDAVQQKEYFAYTSRDFHGQIGLKVEYDFLKSPAITSIGLRAGYQFLKTKTVKDRLNNDWIIEGENPLSLDFSGIYFGVYLKIGK
jgi:hypothetical protein